MAPSLAPSQAGGNGSIAANTSIASRRRHSSPSTVQTHRENRPQSSSEAGLADLAANGLAHTRPEFSAGMPTWRWQKAVAFTFSLTLGFGLVAAPAIAELTLLALMTAPFVFVVLLRVAALVDGATRAFARARPAELPKRRDENLPRYTILVPLYRESAVLGTLLDALAALDYPRDKLEILLVVETGDRETHTALRALALPGNARVHVVPRGAPRTKPRALNFGLVFASGEFVTVYDAEDIPEPDQLRRALAAFEAGGERLGCVQARLNIYNPGQNWLTRQFTIEYSALFDVILPTLERLAMPIPLGGTSNHFRRDALDAVGGWDAYNVTEDADLGLRLARLGWRVGVLASTTWEEAPGGLGNWFGQRTRWLKGWIRTYLVHMRQPWRVLRELGPAKFFGLQVLMAGMVVSPLVHPWFYALAFAKLTGLEILQMPSSGLGDALWHAALFNVVAGYAAAVLLGMLAVVRRRHYRLLLSALFMPVYWLIISAAAYRALIDHLDRPHSWRKTQHFGHTRAARRARGERLAG